MTDEVRVTQADEERTHAILAGLHPSRPHTWRDHVRTEIARHRIASQQAVPNGVVEAIARAFWQRSVEIMRTDHPEDTFMDWEEIDIEAIRDDFRATAREALQGQTAPAGDVVEAIQKIIDRYRVAGANLLEWLDAEDLEKMPRPSGRPAGVPWNMPTATDWQNWASDVACRKFFEALEKAKEAALTAAKQDSVGKIVAWLEEQAEERGKKTQDGWALHWAADAIQRGEHLSGDPA